MFNINLITKSGLQENLVNKVLKPHSIDNKINKNKDIVDRDIEANSKNAISINHYIFSLMLIFFILLMALSTYFKGTLFDFSATMNKIATILNKNF